MSAGKATLHECATVYSLEDVYMMLEILSVDAANRREIARRDRQRAQTES